MAMAIIGNLTVDDMVNADLPYAPPFSLAIDHGIADRTSHAEQADEAIEGTESGKCQTETGSWRNAFFAGCSRAG